MQGTETETQEILADNSIMEDIDRSDPPTSIEDNSSMQVENFKVFKNGNEDLDFIYIDKFADLDFQEELVCFYKSMLAICSKSASKSQSRKAQANDFARQHMFDVAMLLTHPSWNLNKFAEHVGKAVKKPDRRNPILFIMKQADPEGDLQVLSNNSKSLAYALEACSQDASKLNNFFNETSIRECLKAFRSKKKKENDKMELLRTKLMIHNFPPNIRGTIRVELHIGDGQATFVNFL